MPGTVYHLIERALAGFQPFADFRAGRLDRDGYVRVLEGIADHQERFGLNRDQFHLSGRFPVDEAAFVQRILDDLVLNGLLPHARYDTVAFAAFRAQVHRTIDHGRYATYIFPEEERLAYAIAEIMAPVAAGFFGSYYGYWAYWALPALARTGGSAVFLDIDPEVNALAERNMQRLGFAQRCRFVTQDAVAFLAGSSEQFDFAMVDAEGPEHHPDPDYRKKYIYYPIFRQLVPHLRAPGLVVVHNMLLRNLTADSYFAERIPVNQQQFAKLLPLLETSFTGRQVYDTSEGVGVYRR
jgi:predicted O-methyltransferase YrrM